MCKDCGCGDTDLVPVELKEKILSKNDHQAAHNRAHFHEAGVLAVNLMGSPGSGKTAAIEAVARCLRGRLRLAAVSADLATDHDAMRLREAGVPAIPITTGTACHLDARLLHEELHDFAWRRADIFFIENVGNLVCPAVYDLGEEKRIVALAVTEGVDKPVKYPPMFARADLVLVTKMDLLPHLPKVSLEAIEANLARVSGAEVIPLSAETGLGVDLFANWLEAMRRKPEERPRR